MRTNIAALASGLLFGIGLALSGMIDPNRILGFFDVFGDWNPALLYTFVGALGVSAIAFRFVLNRPKPLLVERFALPDRKATLDPQLLVGSAMFGIGWGLSGYCPGPALASLSFANAGTLVFIVAMLIGMRAHDWLQLRRPRTAEVR